MHARSSTLRRLVCAALVVLSLGLAPELAHAQSAARKAGRGIAGMVTSWLEVPGNMYQMTNERGAGWGFTLGFVQGLGMIPVRTLVGVYEFLTCPLELPAHFEPIIGPEFPWSYFDGDTSGGRGPGRAGKR